jgi:hypothetical protein
MDTLDQSKALIRHSHKLIARAMWVRVAAAERIEDSRRLCAAAHEAREAVLRAHGWAGPGASVTAGEVPAGQ